MKFCFQFKKIKVRCKTISMFFINFCLKKKQSEFFTVYFKVTLLISLFSVQFLSVIYIVTNGLKEQNYLDTILSIYPSPGPQLHYYLFYLQSNFYASFYVKLYIFQSCMLKKYRQIFLKIFLSSYEQRQTVQLVIP